MFAGITQGVYEVTDLTRQTGLLTYTVNLTQALCDNLQSGDSISVDGVCQTVVHIDGTHVSFQAIQETLDKTTLNDLILGSKVSIERSVCVGDEIGGHEISGHVVGTAIIAERTTELHSLTLVIQCQPAWMKYILPKGYIAVDGSSLTIGETKPAQGMFYLHLIPETLKLTRLGEKNLQDKVNIEFDHKTKTIVDTVERILLGM